jgi:hypothetical protein
MVRRSDWCFGGRGRWSAYPVVVAAADPTTGSAPKNPVTAFLNVGLGPYLSPSPPIEFPPPTDPAEEEAREGSNDALALAANNPAELLTLERSDARAEDTSVVNDGCSRYDVGDEIGGEEDPSSGGNDIARAGVGPERWWSAGSCFDGVFKACCDRESSCAFG